MSRNEASRSARFFLQESGQRFTERVQPDAAAAAIRGLRRRRRPACRAHLEPAITPPRSARLCLTHEDLERAAEIAAAGWILPPPLPAERRRAADRRLDVRAAGPRLGRPTTMFRLISALEQAGHRCIIYLRRSPRLGAEQHEHRIRAWWPWVKAEVRDAAEGIQDAHAIFATAWETAYPVLWPRPRAGRASTWSRTSSRRSTPPAASPCSRRPPTASAFTASPPGAGWRRCSNATTACRPTTSTSAAISAIARPAIAPDERTGSASTRARHAPPRVRARRSWRSTCSPSAIPRSTSTSTASKRKRLPFRRPTMGCRRPEQLNALYNRCVAGLALSATNSRWSRTRCSPPAAFRWSTTPSTTASCWTTITVAYAPRRRSTWPAALRAHRAPAPSAPRGRPGRCRERAEHHMGRRRRHSGPHRRDRRRGRRGPSHRRVDRGRAGR